MTARAEVVRTPAGTPLQQNFSKVVFSGRQCNFSLPNGVSRTAARYQRRLQKMFCLCNVLCHLLRSTRATARACRKIKG